MKFSCIWCFHCRVMGVAQCELSPHGQIGGHQQQGLEGFLETWWDLLSWGKTSSSDLLRVGEKCVPFPKPGSWFSHLLCLKWTTLGSWNHF